MVTDLKAATVAYFSMEIALDPAIPTYAGGLGILAGDMLRSAADQEVPMVAVSLVHRKGYFQQHLDAQGNQTEKPDSWRPEGKLNLMDACVAVTLEGRQVLIQAWQYLMQGLSGHVLPVYLLDCTLPSNSPWDQTLTDYLYGGDDHYRLCQEVVLGLGGVEMLRTLGYNNLKTYHMNEGHAAFLALGLCEQYFGPAPHEALPEEELQTIRRRCVFTTHTPVPAGHDQFPIEAVRRVLREARTSTLENVECLHDGTLNMTYMALRSSHYINGVAMHHGQVSQGMYPNYPIRAITNGVHAATWASPSFKDLYDRHIPEWRRDNLYLRYAIGLPLGEIRAAHASAKRVLLDEVKKSSGLQLDETIMTIGFARRAAAYKRADLLFSNIERLKWIAHHVGPLQVIYAGKAHPYDNEGKAMIRRVFEAAQLLKDAARVVYVENYDMRWAQILTSGADLWLNTPHRPYEASGTSGMKAAMNGVPSLSVLDGWWIEGCVEGATGWAIGHDEDLEDPSVEIASLYDKLERIILPQFYGRASAYTEVMRSTIALNGSFFNTERMILQYESNAYAQETPSLEVAETPRSRR